MTSGQFTAIANTIISVALLVLAVIAVPIAWKLRHTYKRVDKLLAKLHEDAEPLIRHATAAAENVEYITATIRGDVQRINATLNAANEQLNHAVSLTQGRLNEFSALLSVVQDEAEDLFVTTASTVRGVRTGAHSLRTRGGLDLASRSTDEAGPDDRKPEENDDRVSQRPSVTHVRPPGQLYIM